MKTIEKIEKHYLLIEILDSIKLFETHIKTYKESLDGFSGQFVGLRTKYNHKIDIYNRCIVRLYKRYNVIIKEL